MTYDNLKLTLFCLEKSSVRNGIFKCLSDVRVKFRLKSGKICKNNDHICLFYCIDTCQIPQTMFEH